MRKNVTVFVAIVALNFSAVPSRAATVPAALTPAEVQLLATWNCDTTMASGVHYRETDSIEQIGQWLHGTARPSANSSSQSPYYDYYIGHVNYQWIYIQINPAQGTYFVGTSNDGIQWSIVFPAGEGHYKFTISATQFTIAYRDLTQVCNKSLAPTGAPAASTSVAPPPADTLKCDTWETGQSVAAENYITISKLDAARWKGAKSWWQGAGMDSPSGGSLTYEYNFFQLGGQWISVAVNGSSGDYFIAKSYTSQNLNNTTWTVIYPSVKPGFTFEDVSPENTLPQTFSIVFSDGYQTCCPVNGPSPCPLPQAHLPSAT